MVTDFCASAGLRGEQRGRWLTGALGQPDPQMGDGARGQWRDPLLSPLAVATHMRARAEMHIAAAQTDQFGSTKPRLHGEGEQSRVAPPGPCHSISGGEKRSQFRFRQPGHQPPIKTLRRNGQNPFDGGGMFRMAQGGIAEQGPDRGQSGVAGAHAVLSLALQMVEEGTDQRRIEVVDVEFARRLAVPLRREDQEQPQRVAIGLNRVRADLALAEEAVGEERLQGGGQRTHASPARWRSSRSPARPSSSGAADRYQ